MNSSDDSWILLARVVRPQGRHGEVLADIFTDFPQTLTHRKQLYLQPPAGLSPLSEAVVESHWLHKGRVVLKFSQIDSIAQAETLRGFELITPREARTPLQNDAVYISDLMGLTVVDVSGGGTAIAGEIIAVEPEGVAPAMLVIRTPDGDELLIPFVRDYLRGFEAGRINMELPPGLLAMQAPLTEQERRNAPAERSEESE